MLNVDKILNFRQKGPGRGRIGVFYGFPRGTLGKWGADRGFDGVYGGLWGFMGVYGGLWGSDRGFVEFWMGFLGVPVNGGSDRGIGQGMGRVGQEVYGQKLGFSWKNRGFIEKRGFHGFLVNRLGKSGKEPGI